MGTVRTILKGIGVVFLLWLGLHIWFIISPTFLPGPSAEPGTFAGVQQSLQGLAEARQADPEAEAAYRRQMDLSRPFDNSLVIFYVFPVLLVRVLCGIARRRQISPLAIVAAPAVAWFVGVLLIYAIGTVMGLVLPNLKSIGQQAAEIRPFLSDWTFWELTILAAGTFLVFALRAPRLLGSWVFRLPRRIDRALTDLLDEQDGWLAENNGPDMARIGHGLVVILLTGISSWAVWSLCDGMDGGGVPDTFGLIARIAAIVFSAYLLARTHFAIVDYGAKSPDALDRTPDRPNSSHDGAMGKDGAFQDNPSSPFGWRRDR